MFKSETTSFHSFPQVFQISKNIGYPTSGSGGIKTFKRYLKKLWKSRIWETPNLSTDADSSINIFCSAGFHFSHYLVPVSLPTARYSAHSLSALFSTIQYQFHFPHLGMKGGPMRGIKLIMWFEGQWVASKKIKDKQTDRRSDIGTTRPKRPKGQFGEKLSITLA